MSNLKRRTSSALIIAAAVLALTSGSWGCESRPGVENEFGAGVGRIDADPQTATAAAKAVLNDLDLLDVTGSSTKLDGFIEARTARNERVKISIESRGQGVSEVTVRVGTMGDIHQSAQILEMMRDWVATGAAPAPTGSPPGGGGAGGEAMGDGRGGGGIMGGLQPAGSAAE